MTNENFKAERWIKNGVFGQTLITTFLPKCTRAFRQFTEAQQAL